MRGLINFPCPCIIGGLTQAPIALGRVINFIQLFYVDVITYLCFNSKLFY